MWVGFRGKSFRVNLNFTGYTPRARRTRAFKRKVLVRAAQELCVEVTAKDPQTSKQGKQKSRCRSYSSGRYPQVRLPSIPLPTHLFSSTGSLHHEDCRRSCCMPCRCQCFHWNSCFQGQLQVCSSNVCL